MYGTKTKRGEFELSGYLSLVAVRFRNSRRASFVTLILATVFQTVFAAGSSVSTKSTRYSGDSMTSQYMGACSLILLQK